MARCLAVSNSGLCHVAKRGPGMTLAVAAEERSSRVVMEEGSG